MKKNRNVVRHKFDQIKTITSKFIRFKNRAFALGSNNVEPRASISVASLSDKNFDDEDEEENENVKETSGKHNPDDSEIMEEIDGLINENPSVNAGPQVMNFSTPSSSSSQHNSNNERQTASTSSSVSTEQQNSPQRVVKAPSQLFSPSKRQLKVGYDESMQNHEDSSVIDHQLYENLAELSDDLSKCTRQKLFADVSLKLTGCNDKVYAHRVILANRSNYFKSIFQQQQYCHSGERVCIEFSDFLFPDVFVKVIDYLYSGKITLNLQDVLEVLFISEKLQIDSLKVLCAQFIEHNIDCANVPMLLEYSMKYQCSPLTEFCTSFIDRNISRILSVPKSKSQLFEIEHDTLLYIVKRDELLLTNLEEIELFKAVITWAKHQVLVKSGESILDADGNVRENLFEVNIEKIQKQCEQILNYIRFPLMSSSQLAAEVEPTGIVHQQLLFEAYKHHIVKQPSKQAIPTPTSLHTQEQQQKQDFYKRLRERKGQISHTENSSNDNNYAETKSKAKLSTSSTQRPPLSPVKTHNRQSSSSSIAYNSNTLNDIKKLSSSKVTNLRNNQSPVKNVNPRKLWT